MKRIAALALIAGIALTGCGNGWSDSDRQKLQDAVHSNPNTTADQDVCIVAYVTDHFKRSEVDDSNSNPVIQGKLAEAFSACS